MKLPRLNNLTDLANLLRSIDNSPESELGFDMRWTLKATRFSKHPCGSACCIGGWVQACNKELSGKRLQDSIKMLQPSLDWYECFKLCFPNEYEEAWAATPEQAARAVEILRDTGKCDWKTAMMETSK